MWPELLEAVFDAVFDAALGVLLTAGLVAKRGTGFIGPSLIKSIVIGQFAESVRPRLTSPRVQARMAKKENKMRAMILAVMAMMPSAAMADEIEDAHRQAVAGRDSYWNCLAREYTRDSNKGMSGPDFTSLIASACASERQNFRVMLVG